jgi:hypothetical protein
MVQPIMASLLGLGFPIVEANNPSSDVAFAAGPFMLFRRDAYDAIGGHRALAGEVVEDLALARTIKTSGFRLRYVLGLDAIDLQMYSDLPALWEGWTKNWFLGLDRNIPKGFSCWRSGGFDVCFSMDSFPHEWCFSCAAAPRFNEDFCGIVSACGDGDRSSNSSPFLD